MTDFGKILLGSADPEAYHWANKPPTGVAEAMGLAARFPIQPSNAPWVGDHLIEMKSQPDEAWVDLMTQIYGKKCVAEVRRFAVIDMIFEEWE